MECNSNSGIGTELKLNVGMDPIAGIHLADIDFEVKIFSHKRTGSVTIGKDAAKKIDEDNYIVCVDTKLIGTGRYYMTFTAYIPDMDFPDGLRTEVVTVPVRGANISE